MTDAPLLDGGLCRALYDVAQLLESADRAEERVRRVLETLRGVVPYEQCALLEAQFGCAPEVALVPEPDRDDRILITERLVGLFGHLVDPGEHVLPSPSGQGGHLSVPLVGLDDVIGLLQVRSSLVDYTDEHLRVLSVVAAMLAAYLTSRRARADLAEIALEHDEARRGSPTRFSVGAPRPARAPRELAPRATPSFATASDAPRSVPVAGDPRRLAGVRVLLVERDPVLGEFFQNVLQERGAQVTAVGSAPEALEALQRTRPDVVLLGDVWSEWASVDDLMRDVTARACPLPVASISSQRVAEMDAELAAGFRLHVTKPFEVEDLVEAVAVLAGRVEPGAPVPTPRSIGDRGAG